MRVIILDTYSRYLAVELEASAICTMNCKYCYIDKTHDLGERHGKILSWLNSGKFIGDIAKHNPEYISLWGTEPTLGVASFLAHQEDLLNKCPNLKRIKISSNMLSIDELIELSNITTKKEGLGVDIQMSLDGPEWVNGKNRKPGETDRIVNNSILLAKETAKLGKDIRLNFKPTITAYNFPELLDRAEEYVLFFDDVLSRINSLNKNIKKSSFITIELPGKYSKHDGKIFYEIFKKFSDIELSKTTRTFMAPYTTYPSIMKSMHSDDWWTKTRCRTCSAGDTQIGITVNGKILPCHHGYQDDDYGDSYRGGLEKIGERENMLCNLGNIDGNMFAYVMRGYHDFMRVAVSYTVAAMNELAYCGDVDKEYLDINRASDISQFLVQAFSCPMVNLTKTSSMFMLPLPILIIFGNGAFLEAAKQASRI